jgi:hypothetical protein
MFNKNRYIKLLVVLNLVVPLSACYSLSNLWSDSDDISNNASLNMKDRTHSSFIPPEENEKNIDQFIEEWETVRPALMRVVALEEDMQYLLQSMSEINETAPAFAANEQSFQAVSLEPQYETATVQNYDDATEFKQDKFSQNTIQSSNTANAEPASNIKTLAAPRLTSLDDSIEEKFASQNTTLIDNKFSTQINTIDQTYDTEPKALHSDTSQETFVMNKNEPFDANCAIFAGNKIGEGNAVHLISYKSKQLLSEGSRKIAKQFSDELCGKMPVFKEVLVNGERFYSMRFGPFVDKDEALTVCSSIKKSGQYCGVTDFDGTQIL